MKTDRKTDRQTLRKASWQTNGGKKRSRETEKTQKDRKTDKKKFKLE